MFSYTKEGPSNRQVFLPPPIAGLNTRDPLAGMRSGYATVLENWIPYPDRLEMRYGASDHVTAFANTVKALWTWEGPASASLWATTDAGVYNASAAGAAPALSIALTNGATIGATIATGAGTYLMLVNGTDTLKQFDGTTWSSVAAFGSFNTNTACAIETYKQRLFFGQEDTLTLWYLGANSISGSATSYPLGAIFRRGGAIRALGTWTLDGGVGPDDHLVVVTTSGELAVFSGTDPSTPATWALRGVYYIGRPLGPLCLFKFGGDLLYLCESGIYPLSKALQSTSTDRSVAITDTVQAYFSAAVSLYQAEPGWQAILQPTVPLLAFNLPGYPEGRQLVMNTQSKAWSLFSGWAARCWARYNGLLYFGTGVKVAQALTGSADFGGAITATLMQAYSQLGFPKQKRIAQVRPFWQATADFSYTLGVANDFAGSPTSTLITGASSAASLWGTGVWGTSIWAGTITQSSWRGVPDQAGTHKAPYTQVRSASARVALQGWNMLYLPGGTF